jgi:hypothetical protein
VPELVAGLGGQAGRGGAQELAPDQPAEALGDLGPGVRRGRGGHRVLLERLPDDRGPLQHVPVAAVQQGPRLLRPSGSSSMLTALGRPPAQAGRCSSSSGRATATSRTGAPRAPSPNRSTRSRKVGSAQCRSSKTTTRGRSAASASSSRPVDQAASSIGAGSASSPISCPIRSATSAPSGTASSSRAARLTASPTTRAPPRPGSPATHLVGGRDAEDGHDRVAGELLDRAPVVADHRAHGLVVAGHHLRERLGVEPLTERGGAAQVAEDHRDGPAAAPRPGRRRRQRLTAGQAEPGPPGVRLPAGRTVHHRRPIPDEPRGPGAEPTNGSGRPP